MRMRRNADPRADATGGVLDQRKASVVTVKCGEPFTQVGRADTASTQLSPTQADAIVPDFENQLSIAGGSRHEDRAWKVAPHQPVLDGILDQRLQHERWRQK